jgi:phosphohistidine phosphatase
MKLHLIRHAKTNQSSPTGQDFDRELLPRGQKQGATLHKFLSEKNWDNLQIWCSSSRRTRQTYNLIKKAFPEHEAVFSEEWYLCEHKDWLYNIWKCRDCDNLVLVGHNFGISDLANYLTGGNDVLATSGYICIEFDLDDWSEISRGTGSVIERFRPDDR